MTAQIRIAGREVGPGAPVYVVAELSANHRGRFEEAVALVEAAHRAGADAVKLQTYTADSLTLDCDRPEFRIGEGTAWAGRTLHDLYSEAAMPWEWQPRLKALADGLGLSLFASAFDAASVRFLDREVGVPAFKVASFEIVDLALIRQVAATGKPLVLSTGIATLEEIGEAVDAFAGAGGREMVLLKCSSAYPAPPEAMNLRAIPRLAATFGVPVGLSDHTLGAVVPVAAVALGACLIEKHLTLSRSGGGPDSGFSLEPAEFAAMVEAVRTAEAALAGDQIGATSFEAASRAFRRSLFAVRDIVRGEILTIESVRSIRPADGLPPKFIDQVLGRRAARDIPRGTPLSWNDLVGDPPSNAG